jgi:hypothetical protein
MLWYCSELIFSVPGASSVVPSASSVSDENKLLEGVSCSWRKGSKSLDHKRNSGRIRMSFGKYLFPSEFHLGVEDWRWQSDGHYGR